MATTYHTAIQKLYVAYFNRPADYAGLNYWETVVEAAAGDTTAVSAAFAGSAEYAAEYGGMSNASVVNQVYINLFGRAAEPDGIAYWANAISSGAVTISDAVTAIAAGAQGTDKVAYDSKVLAASAFTTALNTPAEQTGYSGDLANEAAKVFLSGIKTAAELAAAIVPATLDASVAGVIAASTPFTLASGLAALAAAQDAVAEFLVTADGDDDEDTSATAGDLDTAVTDAEADMDLLIPTYSTSTTAIAAALLSDETDLRAATLETAQDDYAEAADAAADIDGLLEAIADISTATASLEDADAAQAAAEVAAAGKVAEYNAQNAPDIALAADGTTVLAADGVTVVALIELDGDELVLADGVDEDSNPGVTALLAAAVALESAELSATVAAEALADAEFIANVADIDGGETELGLIGAAMVIVNPDDEDAPTGAEILTEIAGLEALVEAGAVDAVANLAAFQDLVDDFVAADGDLLVSDLTTLAADVVAAEEAVAELDDAVAALADAEAAVAALEALEDDVDAAEDAFDDAGLNVPVTLIAVTGASAGSDIFVVGDIATSTVVNFGVDGTDSLYIGTDFTLNTGALTTGNNAVLEVFMIQDGANVKIHLETEVYGSDSGAVTEQIITLTGITVAELSLSNGIITAA